MFDLYLEFLGAVAIAILLASVIDYLVWTKSNKLF